jgi:hypothetical protein
VWTVHGVPGYIGVSCLTAQCIYIYNLQIIITSIIFALIELTTLFTYRRVIVLVQQQLATFNIHAHTHSLEQRFALNENARITNTLLPCVYMYTVVSLLTNLITVCDGCVVRSVWFNHSFSCSLSFPLCMNIILTVSIHYCLSNLLIWLLQFMYLHFRFSWLRLGKFKCVILLHLTELFSSHIRKSTLGLFTCKTVQVQDSQTQNHMVPKFVNSHKIAPMDNMNILQNIWTAAK